MLEWATLLVLFGCCLPLSRAFMGEFRPIKNPQSALKAIHLPSEQRKLAYVARVKSLLPIPKKDTIEVAKIDGWQCVVTKGIFCVNDLVVYVGIDSQVDLKDPNFHFLNGQPVKTIRVGGILSQGLLGPMSWLTSKGHCVTDLREGDDVTELLGITKYICPEELSQYEPNSDTTKCGGKRSFPRFIPKTDATRMQTNPDKYTAALAGQEIIITRKEDGCSGTFFCKDGQYFVCGRNFIWGNQESSNFHYFEVSHQLNLKTKMLALGRNLAVQGEIISSKINGNRMKLESHCPQLRVFDIFDIDAQHYLKYDECSSICQALGLTQVPLVYRGSAENTDVTLDGLMGVADSLEYRPGVAAEGIVIKTDSLRTVSNSLRTVFKVISAKYLLKNNL